MNNRSPSKCGGFEPVSNVFCEKNPAKNPIGEPISLFFSRIFNGWQSLLAAVTLTAFDSVEAALLDLCDGQWAKFTLD